MNNSNDFVKGYKRIAKPICVITVLGIAFLAMIPGASAGCVVGPGQTPIAGALVKLVLYPTYSNLTDASGCYILQNVPNGTYEISASKAGYSTNTSTVFVPATQGVEVTKDFILSPGGFVGEYRYYSLSANGVSAKKLAIQSTSGTSFIVPQYGDNGVWKTTVRITDMSGLGTTVTVKYYDTSGNNLVTENIPIPANGTISFIPSDGTNNRPTTGKLLITSTQNIAGTYTISKTDPSDKTMMTQSFYSPTEAASNLIIPQYGDKTMWGTTVAVSDVLGTGATLNVQYYDTSGTLIHTESQTVPPNGMVQWFPTMNPSTPSIGKIVITSTANVIGEYRMYKLAGTGLSSNKLYSSADYGTQFSIPQYGDKTTWGTYVAVSDVTGLGAALTVKYYDMSGALVYTESRTVPPNGMVDWFPTLIPSTPATGKMEITSSSNVVGEYRIYSLDNYDLLQMSLYSNADQAATFVVPYYGNNIDMGSFIAISDVSGVGATLTVRYYTLGGVNTATTTKTLPPNGMVQWFPHTGDGVGAPSEGKVVISS
ncbi:MAG: hypothetical protein FIB08_05910 [Candidatus Methanoperedens sp.]|nr:hypothetical protein [Candidatus Methanoperedens sp.]